MLLEWWLALIDVGGWVEASLGDVAVGAARVGRTIGGSAVHEIMGMLVPHAPTRAATCTRLPSGGVAAQRRD